MSHPSDPKAPSAVATPPSAQKEQAPDLASVRSEIRRIAELIGEARTVFADGTMVNLANLEILIRHACAHAAALPSDHGRQVRGDLEALLYDLDSLETDMTSRFGALSRRPEDKGPKPQTVGAAYQAGVKRAAQIDRALTGRAQGNRAQSQHSQGKHPQASAAPRVETKPGD